MDCFHDMRHRVLRPFQRDTETVQHLTDARLVQTLVGYDPSTETDEGNLQFFFP